MSLNDPYPSISPLLDPYARHFADAVCRIAPEVRSGMPETVWLAAALAAQNTVVRKHVCLPLGPGLRMADLLPLDFDENDQCAAAADQPVLPGNLGDRLRSEDCAFALSIDPRPGAQDAFKPLVLEGNRLYLQRYWVDENTLADQLNTRAGAPPEQPAHDFAAVRRVTRLDLDDAQCAAVQRAVTNRLTIITGGPGTGKTTITSAVVALLLGDRPDCEILLCAPTGKAQARLKEALDDEISRNLCLEDQPALRQRLAALQAATIHRLLKARPPLGRFARHAGHPLRADVLIVDEVSMVDLPLLVKLLAALPEACKVILLGDSDQLAAVEIGAALAEMCEAWNGMRPVACLTRSHRFDPERGIGRLKEAVQNGAPDVAWRILRRGDEALGHSASPTSPAELEQALARHFSGHPVRTYLRAATPDEAFARFGAFRILCATRHGPCGVEAANRCAQALLGVAPYAHGYPVMVTVNDYSRRLFNGDIGLCLRHPESGEVRVWFPASDGTVGAACDPATREPPTDRFARGFRSLSTAELPDHEPVFAMTVHKAQGSGFDEVLLILPPYSTRVLTRELLYTGITRARSRCLVWADEAIFKAAVAQRTLRMSGLHDKLLPIPVSQ